MHTTQYNIEEVKRPDQLQQGTAWDVNLRVMASIPVKLMKNNNFELIFQCSGWYQYTHYIFTFINIHTI